MWDSNCSEVAVLTLPSRYSDSIRKNARHCGDLFKRSGRDAEGDRAFEPRNSMRRFYLENAIHFLPHGKTHSVKPYGDGSRLQTKNLRNLVCTQFFHIVKHGDNWSVAGRSKTA